MNLHECALSLLRESLFRETVLHIFQTIFQIIFPSVLTRHLHFCSQMLIWNTASNIHWAFVSFFLGPFLEFVLFKEKKSGIHLLQATHQILFVLSCVVCCLSGVMHNFYLFLLPKLPLKQEMTVAPRRPNWGDTQMFILHYFSVPWQFL